MRRYQINYLQKNLWLEKATLAAEEITKQVQAAREAAYASPPVKKAEAELEAVQNTVELEKRQFEKETETSQTSKQVYPTYKQQTLAGRTLHYKHNQLLTQAHTAIEVAKAASLETESYKALCAEHATLHGILAEARRSRTEAETFVKIFSAICQTTLETLSKTTA